MTKKQKIIIADWLASAEEDRQTALAIYKLKHYGWSLFIFHLAIEKLLKANLIKQNIEVIFTHKLVKLADLAKLQYSPTQARYLAEISTFNIKARYDIEKMAFYKKADKSYTEKWIAICQNIYQWSKRNL